MGAAHNEGGSGSIEGQLPNDTSLAEVFRQTLAFLHRHVWFIFWMGLGCALVTVVVTHRMERLYKSSVQLMVDPPVQSPIEAEANPLIAPETGFVEGQILLIEADDTLIRVIELGNLTEIPYFQAKPVNVVVRGLHRLKAMILGPTPGIPGLPDGAPNRETLAAKSILSEVLTVSREGETNVISIAVRANSSGLAQSTAALVADTYVGIRLDQRQSAARAFSDWINTRAAELRMQLTEAEAAVTAYRIEHGLFSETGDFSLNDQRLTEVNAELIRSRADLAQKSAALDKARAVRDGGGDILSLPEVQGSEIVTALRNQLLVLELRERDLTTNSNRPSPRVDQIRQQNAAIQVQLMSEVTRIIETIKNEVETLESRTTLLSTALSQAGGQSKIETQISVGLRQLERVAEVFLQQYQRYLDNAGLAAELKSFTTSGTQVVTSATVPINPYFPLVKAFTILSFIMGCGIAIFIALAREAMDTSLRHSNQVEALLNTRVRAQIPHLTGQDIPEVIENDPKSAFSETISVLRYMLLSANSKGGRAPVFLVTSSVAGEGKTSIATSFARSASGAGQKVLVIDADLRRAGLTKKFGYEGEEGFADVLMGRPWQAPDIMGEGVFDILSAGTETNSPLNALESPNLAKFLELARGAYDLIVIDGPPVAYVGDCTILSKHSDQVLFIVRWGLTLRGQAIRGFQRLPKPKIAAVIMNDCPLNSDIGLGPAFGFYTEGLHKLGKLVNLQDWRASGVSLKDRQA